MEGQGKDPGAGAQGQGTVANTTGRLQVRLDPMGCGSTFTGFSCHYGAFNTTPNGMVFRQQDPLGPPGLFDSSGADQALDIKR